MVKLTTNRLTAETQIALVRCFVFIDPLRYRGRNRSLEWYETQYTTRSCLDDPLGATGVGFGESEKGP